VRALVVLDMLKDFVDGCFVFSNDAHEPADPELGVWGGHAMAGTPGAQVIEALEPQAGPREPVSPKRVYGAFDGTALDERLRSLGVGEEDALAHLHSVYGARIAALDELVAEAPAAAA